MMTGDTSANFETLSLTDAEWVDQACDRFEKAWRGGEWPCIEAYLDAVPATGRRILLLELVKLELELRRDLGEHPSAVEYAIRFADLRSEIDLLFRRDRPSAVGDTTIPVDMPVPAGDAPTVDISTLAGDPEDLKTLPRLNGDLGRQVGDYLLLDRIGHGGMGVVYRALQRGTRRIVALKLIKSDWRGDSTTNSNNQAAKRFTDEAKAHASLDHENIVPLHDAGHVDGLLYFSMRLIKGRSLAQRLLSDGPLEPRKAAYYVEAIARAVQYAHDHNILHRDLKPSNIMVDENDRPYLIDLGLARSLDATDFTSLSGKVMGTAEYMSPEQAQGRSDIDHRTDVYGLGATLFALLTGRPPFTGDDPMVVLRKVIDEEPSWPRAGNRVVDRELKAICLKSLEKDRERRIAGAGALAKALRDYLEYRPTGITTPSPWARLEKWVKRKPWRATAAVLGVAATVILAASLGWHARQSRIEARALLQDVLTVPVIQLPDKLAQISRIRSWVDPLLRSARARAVGDPASEFRLSLALLEGEPERAPELARLLLELGLDEHAIATTSLRPHWHVVSPMLFQVLDDPASPVPRRGRAAAALITLDSPSTPAGHAYDELKIAPDPERGAYLLDWLARSRIDPRVLVDRLAIEPDVSIQRRLILALSELSEGESHEGLFQETIARFAALYRDHPDPGVHSCLARLLRRLGSGNLLDEVDASMRGKPSDGRRWLVTSWGKTMAIIGGEDDPIPVAGPIATPLPRFAIGVAETTMRDYLAFKPEHVAIRKRNLSTIESRPELPADFVSYNDAAEYCNWRTLRDGLPESERCYSANRVGDRLELVPNYSTRRGYRLPSLAEWEKAARAGTISNRYFGPDPTLIRSYAWGISNADFRSHQVAELRPNDYGLFDILGNLIEWCYNPSPVHDRLCRCGAADGASCQTIRFISQRGGCYLYVDGELVARPNHDRLDERRPNEGYSYTGFRIVKGLP